MAAQEQKSPLPELTRSGKRIHCRLAGSWRLGEKDLSSRGVEGFFAREGEGAESVVFEDAGIENWDSSLPVFVVMVRAAAERRQIPVQMEGLPPGCQRLVDLALAVPEREAGREKPSGGWLAEVGLKVVGVWAGVIAFLAFFGEVMGGVLRLFRGKSAMRRRDFLLLTQRVGAEALPIVALIAFLVGAIISFLGAVVLRRFGAEYYVSYLVGYGMLREMGAIMAGVIMAGRTGAAFAAEIGSMKVSEEVDALETLGVSPIDYLVMPRLAALILMMPLLTVYADVIGIFGGFLVAAGMLDIPFDPFFSGMNFAVGGGDFFLGIAKGAVFGVIIALSGCLRGMQCGRSADAVGRAATSAVVTAITAIIAANAVMDWLAALYSI